MLESDPPQTQDAAATEQRGSDAFIRKSSRVGIWYWYTSTGYVTWDPGKDAALLFPVRGELRFSDWLGSLHHDDVGAVRARLAQAAEGRQSFRLRFRVAGRDGQQRWITAEGAAVPSTGPTTMAAQMWESSPPSPTANDPEAPLVRVLSAMADSVTIWRALRDAAGHIADFELSFINDTGCRVNGMSREEQLGRPMRQWIPVKQDDGMFHACCHVVRTGEPLSRDWRLESRGADGERHARYFAVHIARLDDGVIVTWYEVTRQRQLAQKSQHELAFLRSVLEHSPVALYVRDTDGHFLLANAVTRRPFGAAGEGLIGRSAREVWGEGDPPWAHETARVVAHGKPLEFEDDVLLDGVKRRFQVVEFPIRDASGRVSAIGGTGTDITGHEQVLEQLAESESRLRLATEAAGLGIWTWDMRANTVYWSSECYKLTGRLNPIRTVDEFKALVHPDDFPDLMESIGTCLEANSDYRVEFRFFRPDGEERWLLNEGRCDMDNGQPVRVMGIMQDITDRKRAELALQRAERNKDRFMTTLAHELRNYISPLRYSLHGLESQVIPGTSAVERVTLAQRQLQQVEQLIEELMEAARIREGKLVLHRERTVLGSVIDSAVAGCRHALEARGQHVAVDAPGDPLELEIDPMRVGQALTNLLLNASKFSPVGSVIRLRHDREGSWARVELTDPGIGFGPDLAGRLFDLHEQASEGAHGGLGMGLYLVRQFIQLHGGTAHAHSDGPGRGSTFTLKLPLSAA